MDESQKLDEVIIEELENPEEEKTEEVKEEKESEEKDPITMEALMQKLEQLDDKFTEKIETDEYKNQLFDKLHQQLRMYQEDVIATAINPIIMEVIQLLDGLKAQRQRFPEEATPENYNRLIEKFDGVIEDVEDLLEGLDVDIYSIEGNHPDPKRQKIIKTVPTDEKNLNNLIAKKISDGYIRQNHIIKYEKISVYKYQEDKEDGNK